MSPFIFEIVGDALEVFGVFFLSVEAIKVKNLDKLRDRFLLLMKHSESGTFQPQKTKWTPAELRQDHLELRHFFLSHYGAGLGIITGLLLISGYLSPNISSFVLSLVKTPERGVVVCIILLLALFPIAITLLATRKKSLSPPTIVMLLMAFTIIPVGILPMLLGEAAHQGSRFAIRAILRFLQWIAQGTPTGTIGILGFLAVCVGKVIQLLAGSVQH